MFVVGMPPTGGTVGQATLTTLSQATLDSYTLEPLNPQLLDHCTNPLQDINSPMNRCLYP